MSKNAFRLSVLTEDIGKRCQIPKTIVEDAVPVVQIAYPDADSDIVDQECLKKVLAKISMCPNLDSLLAIEADMNQLGLAFYTVPGGKSVLCKIVNGHPSITSAMDDYLVLGMTQKSNVEVSDRMASCIQAFVSQAASGPSKVMIRGKSFHGSASIYGQVPLNNNG